MRFAATALALVIASASAPAWGATVLYTQNFEDPNPVGPGSSFVNNGQDLSQQLINTLYGNQPAGFQFAQANTVETLRIGGNLAFGGQGYDDDNPAIAGQFVIGFLSNVENDLLGLSFNVGTFDFLNVRADISSIDLSCCGAGAAGFVPTGTPASIPIFRFSLFNNPNNIVGVGGELGTTLLGSFTATGKMNPSKNTLDFSEALGGLNATASHASGGNVILQIDLQQGGYAALDNLCVVASEIQGDVGLVPEPATWAMMLLGFGAVGASLRARRGRSARGGRACGSGPAAGI